MNKVWPVIGMSDIAI